MREIYGILKNRAKEKEKKFLEATKRLKDRDITLILFGSQAKGRASFLSDYDVVLIGEAEIDLDFIDLFKFRNVDEVKMEIDKLNTIVLDAFIEGKPIIDNLGVYDRLKKYALNKVKDRRIKKTRLGWVPDIQQFH